MPLPTCMPTVASPSREKVWNSSASVAPARQPPLPSLSSIAGLVLNETCWWAIAVSARASSRPLGEPSPLVRSKPGWAV